MQRVCRCSIGMGVVGPIVMAGFLGTELGSAHAEEPTAYSWSGPYIGLSFGERWNRADWTTNGFIIPGFPGVNPVFPDIDADLGGARPRYGGYAGYNYQIDHWVLGAEADIGDKIGGATSAIGIPGTGSGFALTAGANPSQTSFDASWDASIRARAGYLIAPNILLYGTGGVAFQHIGETIFCSALIPSSAGCGLAGSPNVTSSVASTLVGWTAGGGVEAEIAGPWLLRAEYRYSDFGTFNHVFPLGPDAIGDPVVGTRIATHLMDLGVTYKFGPPAAGSPQDVPLPHKAPPPPTQSWTGLYGGFAAGGRHTDADWTTTTLTLGGIPFADNQASFDDIAFRYGGYAGFNYQIGRVVAGLEGGVGDAANSTKSRPGVPGLGGAPGPSPDFTSVGTHQDANIVGRLGYLIASDLLFYGVGGVAFQRATFTSVCTFVGECLFNNAESFSTTRTGPSGGLGVEAMFAGNWLARLDYRYADFGRVNHTFFLDEPILSPTTNTALRTETITFGIAYLFKPGA